MAIMKKKYDIFISYRRAGGFESANLIAEKLRRMGYSVFFDLESLRSGKFNDQLYGVIDRCRDFVLVLPQGGLDRCSLEDGTPNQEDWIRKEVTYALARGKNIVPVMLARFEWPSPMPVGLEVLRDYQAVTATSHEVFDLAMQRLAGYMRSRPHRFRLLKRLLAVLVILLACWALAYGTLLLVSDSVCRSVANEYAFGMGLVHQTRADEENLKKAWTQFRYNYGSAQTLTMRADCERDMRNLLSHQLSEISGLRQQVRPRMQLSGWQTFLLSLHGSQREDVQALPMFVESYMDDMDSLVCVMRRVMDDGRYTPSETENVDNRLAFYETSVNMMYYSYLQEITRLPRSCRKIHDTVGKSWTLLPNVPLSLPPGDYEELAGKELEKMNDITALMAQNVKIQENTLYEMGRRLDTLEAIAQAQGELLTPGARGNEEVLNVARERVDTKRELVEQKKAELNEEREKVKAIYAELRQKCTITAEDSEGYQWGKIIHLARFLAKSVQNSRAYGEMAVIRPDAVYTDLCRQLDLFRQLHPQAAAYIPALKQYYALVSEGQRPLGGQLIFAFKDGATHPLYQVGDIIVSRNGKAITDYSSLKAAVPTGQGGTVEFLRLEHGQLRLHREKVPETEVLTGYLEVGEY